MFWFIDMNKEDPSFTLTVCKCQPLYHMSDLHISVSYDTPLSLGIPRIYLIYTYVSICKCVPFIKFFATLSCMHDRQSKERQWKKLLLYSATPAKATFVNWSRPVNVF